MARRDRRAGSGAPATGGGASTRSADHMFDLAVAHHRAGRLAEAESLYRDSLSLDPNHADSLNCLGILAHQCGRNDAALELIGRAIAVQERNPQYHYNIALVLAAAGRMNDAVTHNQRAIALKPDYTDAHTNLAGALASLGRWAEAEVHFRRTLSQSPQSPQAYGNLAGALQAQGKQDEALGILTRGLAVAETDDLKAIFALCLQEQRSVPKVDRLRAFVERALVNGWARASDLANFVIALIKQSETIRHALARPEGPPATAAAQEIYGPRALAALAGDRLLQALLESTPVCDLEIERLLTDARHAALDLATAADKTSVSDDVLKACCALAQQCFINEYVFAAGPELERAMALRDQVAAALAAGQAVAPVALAVVAAYVPLHSIAGVQALLEGSWPDPVARLVTQQVREPAREQKLRTEIRVLTPIDDGVSAAVRQQYEENPCPRWVKPAMLVRPMTFDDYLRSQLAQPPTRPLGKPELDVLIAGCGTGRDATEMARWCVGAKILAIDLSLASLGHAQRKTEELKLTNVDYAQADALKLASLGRTFDVIEAIGLLHTLADPAAGWRALTAALRPGGFMHVALPRAAGRDDISAARDFAAARGYGPGADDIRRCRQDLLAPDAPAPANAIARYQEFFTTSDCREMLFPAQDHTFTIADIKSALADNRLDFLGFEDSPYGEYGRQYPDDRAMTNLDQWQQLETASPASFGTTYQFWVQKPA